MIIETFLKNVIEEHPDALNDENLLKGYLNDLYPPGYIGTKDLDIKVLVLIFKSGVAKEIMSKPSISKTDHRRYCDMLGLKTESQRSIIGSYFSMWDMVPKKIKGTNASEDVIFETHEARAQGRVFPVGNMKLYLNFARNLEKQTYKKDNYFKEASIRLQYEQIVRKYQGLKGLSLERLIELYCGGYDQQYHICIPSFVRDPDEYSEGEFYNYRNLVIRAEAINQPPHGYDLLIFGDVSIKKDASNWRNELVVKGIDFIDSSISKYGERSFKAAACCAFTQTGKKANYPESTYLAKYDVLSQDFIDDVLIKESPVPDFDEAGNIYYEWDRYLDFRFSYLEKESQKSWAVSDIEVIPAYIVDKALYMATREWKDLSFRKPTGAEPVVVLTDPVDGSREYPLIKIVINEKGQQYVTDYLLAETNPRNFEMLLTPSIDDSIEDDDYSEKTPKIDVGERYHIFNETITPDCSDIEEKAKKEKVEVSEEINRRYDKLIELEIEKDDSLRLLRDALKERLLGNLQLPNDGSIEYDISMFESCDSKIQKEIKEKIGKYEKIIEAANLNYSLKSRNKTEKQLEKVVESRDKQIADAEKGKKRVFEEYISKCNIDPIEGRISAKLDAEMEPEIAEKRRRLQVQYENEREETIEKELAKIDAKAAQDKEKRFAEKTVKQWVIYFLSTPQLPDNTNEQISSAIVDSLEDINDWDEILLAHNNIREKVKLNRQRQALNNFFNGVVKNPYLALQLFSPQNIKPKDISSAEEPEWFLESLNKEQKEAVKLALNSEGMFLLQGPPGTGKTQVIAELATQLVKKGKKVAISSETHKAIENVFDRLPKTPDIRPFRLSRYGNRSDYRPELLVDNFYANVIGRLQTRSKQLENPAEYKKQYKANMDAIKAVYDSYLECKQSVVGVDDEIRKHEDNCKDIEDTIVKLDAQRNKVFADIDVFERVKSYIRKCDTVGDNDCGMYLTTFGNKLMDMLFDEPVFGTVAFEHISELYSFDDELIRQELLALNEHARLGKMIQRNAEAKERKAQITDELTEEALDGFEDEFQSLRLIIKNTGAQIKNIQSSLPDISDLKLLNIIPKDVVMGPSVFDNFMSLLQEFRERIRNVMNDSILAIDQKVEEVKVKVEAIDDRIAKQKESHRKEQDEIQNLRDSDTYTLCSEAETKIRNALNTFIHDFLSSRPYSGIDDGMKLITSEWKHVSRKSKALEEEAKRLPVYKEICKYLDNPDLLEEDRERYTAKLYDRVNIYGFTSSSGYRYNDLSGYGIPEINIQQAGIDVVIIDEVSKSSFVDLLVPILYGKTVVLVGDHRQLPPMYDLRYLRREDFAHMGYADPSEMYEENLTFTNLYEDSLFKKLFTQARTQRGSLRKQYRCHSHIMDVFNYFYGYGGRDEGLTVGSDTQDSEKDHMLTLPINGNPFITPDKHIYFIDSDGEDRNERGSSSKTNDKEALVVETLVKKLNAGYGELISSGKIGYNPGPDNKVDERLSLGVICTYGDQARLLRNWYNSERKRIRSFTDRRDERLMFDTVDNFQGDERDIIIVSMVKSPKAGTTPDSEFIRQFERINVAYSRARRMLIIVGNRNYLANECKIDLPDMYGRGADYDKPHYPVYQKIIDTIEQKGRILRAEDIIGESDERN